MAFSQPGSNDPTFNPSDTGLGNGDGFNEAVHTIARQPDGKMVVGGNFTSYNGVLRNRIVRLNADGTLDPSFNPGTGANNVVNVVAIQPDGKIMLGGSFYKFNGVEQAGIARLNSDGSFDHSFNPGIGFDRAVYSIVFQPDGKIIAGGGFTFINGILRRSIARLNPDGSLDTSFNFSAGLPSYITVNSVVLQPDGKILIGGDLVTAGGVYNKIIRLHADGSIDTSFNAGVGFTSIVINVVALQPDGKVILGGNFTSFNGVAHNKIVRLNADGSLDASFNAGAGFDGDIITMALQPNGKIVVGGYFIHVDGSSSRRIARLHSDGSVDLSFNTSTGFDEESFSIILQPDGRIVVGGNFGKFSWRTHSRITRLNNDGSPDTTFNPGTGFNKAVYAMAIQSDGKIIAGGLFTSFNGASRFQITRLNTDGSLDTTFNAGIGSNGSIISMVLQPDEKIVIQGDFTEFNGVPRKSVARLNVDGSLDTTFNPLGITDGFASSLALQPDGKLIVGGSFTNFGGVGQNKIARLNIDGSLDTTFNSDESTSLYVYSVAVQPDGKVIVGGEFTLFNGEFRDGILRLNSDGSLDNSFDPGPGIDGYIRSAILQPDGKILVLGTFSAFNGIPRTLIARLNSDGSLDTSFNPGAEFGAQLILQINSIAFQQDGKMVIAGAFTSFNGVPRKNIVRLNTDGSLDASFDPGAGFDNTVYSVILQQDQKIVVAGVFTSYNGIGRNRIARLQDNRVASIENRGFGTLVRSYPNPTEGRVIIELGDIYPGVQVTVRNLMGEMILSRKFGAAHTVELNLNELADGIYLLDVSSALTGAQTTLKIVKN
ncbi:MAG: T9SS type A sorting domain-containing protein [Bacteroidia bacterium]|nr:T9SS type A sorting domain-containing protein [Bacteroidia bacterium]